MAGPTDALESVLAATVRRRGQVQRPIRIAVDGRDAAGKTTFADHLARELLAGGTEAYRASIDDWQHPPEIRHRRGLFSPEGYYMDGFAFESMNSRLLEPFATGAAFVLRTYDIEREQAVEQELVVAGMAPVLVVDGVFLLRSEIQACWDLAVYLRVSRATSIERGVGRDGARSGEVLLERRRYEQRYAPAQDLYHEEVSPEDRADVVIDYEDLGHPVVVRG